MIISLFSGSTLEVSDDTAAKLDLAITRSNPPPPKNIRIPILSGDTVVVAASTINGIYPKEVWETMEHEKIGDKKCYMGFWHKKGEICNHEKITVPGAQAKRVNVNTSKISPEKLELAKRNLEQLTRTGRIGTEGLSPEAVQRIEERRQKVLDNRAKYSTRPVSKLTEKQQARIDADTKKLEGAESAHGATSN